jgi:hypothetical protein
VPKGVSESRLRKAFGRMLAKEFRTTKGQEASIRPFVAGLLASGAVAIFLDAIWAYLAVSGLVHMASARVILVFGWLVGVTGIVLSGSVWGRSLVHKIRIGVASAIILGVTLYGLDCWTTSRYRPPEMHLIGWADFPNALVEKIADAVYRRMKLLFGERNPLPKATIVASATADAVSRIYFRGVIAPGEVSTGHFHPYLQEIFYEWSLRATLDQEIQGATTIRIRENSKYDERVRVSPPGDVTVSELEPRWLSGFKEPGEPNYFERTIVFIDMGSMSRDVTITIWRPIKSPSVWSAFDLYRTYEIRAAQGSTVKAKPFDASEAAITVLPRLTNIYKATVGDNHQPVPVKSDPDLPDTPLTKGEVLATGEARCQDNSCQHMTMSGMEVVLKRQ